CSSFSFMLSIFIFFPIFFFSSYGSHRDLHSFPTRRSSDLSSVLFYFYLGMAILAIWAVYQAWSSQSRTETIHPFKAFCHLLAFYLSYLLVPLVFFSIYAGCSGYYSFHEAVFVFFISAVLSYARFIEPHLIQVKTTQYQINADKRLKQPVRIALIADLHIGLFSGHERQLRQIVHKLNHVQPD